VGTSKEESTSSTVNSGIAGFVADEYAGSTGIKLDAVEMKISSKTNFLFILAP
jgi:hypothetical protein